MDLTVHSTEQTPQRLTAQAWLIWGVAGLSFAWNAYGAQQFTASLGATPESLMAAGLTADQALIMTSYPTWMTVAFAIGVFGGLVGSVFLALRKRQAGPIFYVSLASYIALYIGDIVYGVFDAMGMQQVIILSTVVAVAAGLSLFARWLAKTGQLA